MIRPSQHEPFNGTEDAAAGCWSELAEIITRCCRLIRAHLADHANQHDISDAQFSLLWLCDRAPECGVSQNQLVAELGMSAAHVSGSVERLRQKGLLSGQRSSNDRRRQLWTLTPAGKSVLKAVLDDLGPWSKRLNEQFSIKRRDHLASLLDELNRALSTGEALTPPTRDATKRAPKSRGAGPKALTCQEGDR